MNASHLFLDYDTLRFIWWALLGVLLIGFAVLDGFDMGMAILLPFVARTDTERRILLNTVGPVWEAIRDGSFSAAVRSLRRGRCSMPRLFPDSILPCCWCWPRLFCALQALTTVARCSTKHGAAYG